MFFVCRKIFLEGEKLASKQDGQHFKTPLSNKERLTRDKQTLNCRRMLASYAIWARTVVVRDMFSGSSAAIVVIILGRFIHW